MKVQEIETDKGLRYILLDNEYNNVILVNSYLKFLDNLGKAPNTLKTYAYALKSYYEFLNVEGLEVDDIFTNDKKGRGPLQILSDFIVWLQYPKTYSGVIQIDGEEASRSNNTVNFIVNNVLKFYDYLAKNNDMAMLDVFVESRGNSQFKNFLYEMGNKKTKKKRSVLKLKETEPQIKYITQEQFGVIINLCNTRRDKLIVGLMYECGLRLGEVLGLHIEDYEMQDHLIRIVPRDNNDNMARVKNGNGGIAYIPKYLEKILYDYIVFDLDAYDTNYMFVNMQGENKGKPMKAITVQKLFERLSEKAGFHVTPHMCRHGFATERINAGWNAIDIKDALRHKQIQTTGIYAHISNETKKKKTKAYYEEANKDFGHDKIDFLLDVASRKRIGNS